MAPTKAEARSEFFKSSLEVKLDSDGQLQIKTRPIFDKEMRKILREISDTAREIVKRYHEKPRKRVVSGRVVTVPATGNLRRSISPGTVKGLGPHRIQGTVTAGSSKAPYAWYVHEGAREHDIWPKKIDGVLVFAGKSMKGNTYKRDVVKLLTDAEIEELPKAWRTKAQRYREHRRASERSSGRRMRRRPYQPDVYTDTQEFDYADRAVVVPSVHHPGNKPNRFLWAAAARVVSQHGGRVNLPGRADPVQSR